MFKMILHNIVTTLLGCFAGLPVIVEGVKTGSFATIVTGAGVFLLGLVAKDGHK